MSIKVSEYSLLQWDNMMVRCESRPKQDPSINRLFTTNDKEAAAVFPGHNYLCKFSPVTAEVCETLHKLTSVEVD